MKKLNKKQKIIVGVIGGIFLILLVAGNNFMKKNIKGEVSILGVGISEKIINNVAGGIKENVGNIKINYTVVSEDKYLEKLNNSFIYGNEPYDIIMVKNDMLLSLSDSIVPFKITEEEVKTLYLDTVYRDFYSNGFLYAKPIFIDNLALYYNRSILNKMGVFEVPDTWEELVEVVSKVKDVDEFGDVGLAGIGMGSSENVKHSVDILSLLMMQYGTRIYDGNALFANSVKYHNRDIIPGEKALSFYTKFSNAGIGNKYYTWNAGMEKDIDLFSVGKLVFYLGTGMDREIIRDKNANLDYGISFIPQFENSPYEANLSTYYGLAVNKFSSKQEVAKLVVDYLTSPEVSAVIVDEYKLSPALRSLSSLCNNEYYQNVFCSQSINSFNWSKPMYNSSIRVFKDMIDNVSTRGSNALDMVKSGQGYINDIKTIENE